MASVSKLAAAAARIPSSTPSTQTFRGCRAESSSLPSLFPFLRVRKACSSAQQNAPHVSSARTVARALSKLIDPWQWKGKWPPLSRTFKICLQDKSTSCVPPWFSPVPGLGRTSVFPQICCHPIKTGIPFARKRRGSRNSHWGVRPCVHHKAT